MGFKATIDWIIDVVLKTNFLRNYFTRYVIILLSAFLSLEKSN